MKNFEIVRTYSGDRRSNNGTLDLKMFLEKGYRIISSVVVGNEYIEYVLESEV